MIPGSANPLLLASAAGAAEYQIERSLRFNSADSAHLSRTFTSAGNRRTWTWSCWVKRCALDAVQYIFGGPASPSYSLFYFTTADQLAFVDYSTGSSFVSNAVFRDTSAWLHAVLTVDTYEIIDTLRYCIYVNSTQLTAASYAPPGYTYQLSINQAANYRISSFGYNNTGYLSAYLADIHFIDGQALDPTSFGYTDTNGVWQPKAYTGSYGTNGFHLDFADNSAATTAGIGKDVSGNGNDWTPNNFSVAAGAGNDSLVDFPTNYGTDTGAGGEVRGNYCTWNPLKLSIRYALANGNLDVNNVEAPPGPYLGAVATVGVSSGKWYWEIVVTSGANTDMIAVGLTSNTSSPADAYAGSTSTNGWGWRQNGSILKTAANITVSNTPASYTNGDVLQIALDADAGKVWLGKNGTWTASGNPAAGTTQTITYAISEAPYFPVTRPYSGASVANFGQRPFTYTAPSGYKALCTTNLPTTITTSGSYTGNGAADGPFVYLNGVPTAMTVNGNSVTFGTHADKLSNGFKVRATSFTYNQNAATYNYSITSTGDPFTVARAQSNP